MKRQKAGIGLALHSAMNGRDASFRWLRLHRGLGALAVAVVLQGGLAAAAGPNPILFVTQVPQATEVNDNVISNVFLGVGAGFGNHLGGTWYAPRGGDNHWLNDKLVVI